MTTMQVVDRVESLSWETNGHLSFRENVFRLLLKYAPGKLVMLRGLERFGGPRGYVHGFYTFATPFLAGCFGSHDIHLGYFDDGDEDWRRGQERLSLLVGEACRAAPESRLLDVGSRRLSPQGFGPAAECKNVSGPKN
jgi:hypothetical protein